MVVPPIQLRVGTGHPSAAKMATVDGVAVLLGGRLHYCMLVKHKEMQTFVFMSSC